MHRGDAGVGALNARLQEQLNPAREGVPEARAGGRAYRPGDRVLQLKNDYDLEVFNGDLATIRAVDPTEQELVLELDDGRAVPTHSPACTPWPTRTRRRSTKPRARSSRPWSSPC
jgi:exodeoxyribonuclease V alpha subunit